MATTPTRSDRNDLPEGPVWRYSQSQLTFLVGRLTRIARMPHGRDHKCSCQHAVVDHFPNGRCGHGGCDCEQVSPTDFDHGCGCAVCVAKDALESVQGLL
jgi:hypothetical protein